jgi:hypothetical protein
MTGLDRGKFLSLTGTAPPQNSVDDVSVWPEPRPPRP